MTTASIVIMGVAPRGRLAAAATSNPFRALRTPLAASLGIV